MTVWTEVDGKNPEVVKEMSQISPREKVIVVLNAYYSETLRDVEVKYETIVNLDDANAGNPSLHTRSI